MASSHAVTFSIHTPCSSSILVVVHVDGFDCIMYFNFLYHTLASQARVSKRSLQPWTATPKVGGSNGHSPTLLRSPGPPISLYTCHRYMSGIVMHGPHHICCYYYILIYRNFLRLNKKK
jgi:hypothetical protein